MDFLKNISVRVKLMIITIPLAVALIFSVIFMAVEIQGTQSEVTNVYYDILYTVNNKLVNGDRDFYQSLKAAMQDYDFANGYTGAPPEFTVGLLPGFL
ncbi:MAG: hypothetical protein IKO11_07695, partial [Lachnospiraceae bacterium]|nr:hypothetical protein [Lachnospiraceae bacterium]